jgi:O-antigen/teichoic acid export membrane protein
MLVKQSLLYLAARAGTGIVTLLVLTLYTRLMTPAEYGFFTLVLAVESITFIFSILPLCSASLRMQPATRDQNDLHSAIATIYLGLIVVLAAIFLVAPLFFPDLDSRLCRWALAIVVAHGWLEINQHLQTARLQAMRFVLTNAARSFVTAALGLALVSAGMGVEGAIIAYLSGMLVPGVVLTVIEWRGVRLRRPTLATLRTIAVFGGPLSLSYALDVAVYFSDRMAIAFLAGADAVGRYASGFDLAEKSLSAIMIAVGSAGFSIALRLYEQGDRASFERQLKNNITLLVAISLPAAVGIGMVSHDLAQLLGVQFRSSAEQIIPVIALMVFVAFMRANYFDHAFYFARRTLWQTINLAITAVLNIGLNLALIPRLGLIGAAYASLIAYAVALILSAVVGRTIMALPVPPRDILKVAAATAIMAIVLYGLPEVRPPFALIVRVAVGASVYFACALAFNVWDLRDKMPRPFRLWGRIARASR